MLTIGSSAFRSCSSLVNIAIPNKITSITYCAFYSCSALETVIIGESVNVIGTSAFQFCSNLRCIYFYGDAAPTIYENAFGGVPATSVMTTNSYNREKFGPLNVSRGTIDECLPPTLTFTQSDTFSGTFTQSSTFTQSNTFSESSIFTQSNTFTESSTFSDSFPFGATVTHSFALTYSLTITQTVIAVGSFVSNTFLLSAVGSTYTSTHSSFVFYEYATILYSSYYSFYSHFFTIIVDPGLQQRGGLRTDALVGIVCGLVAAVLLIAGIIVFVTCREKKEFKRTQADRRAKTSTKSLISLLGRTRTSGFSHAQWFRTNNQTQEIINIFWLMINFGNVELKWKMIFEDFILFQSKSTFWNVLLTFLPN